MTRVSNFSPGPAGLPTPVLETAQRELLDHSGTGMSIMEQSHRGKAYEEVHQAALERVRRLVGVPADYDVLFLQGGASLQFAMVPMNLLHPGRSADHVHTGTWSRLAMEEARLVGTVRVAASTEMDGFRRVPRPDEIAVDPGAAYLHLVSNNTIEGTQFHAFPETGDVPLVADMSSDFLWAPLDVTRFGLIFAGAQKNLGPSGVCLVIVRKDLVARGRTDIPRILRYATHAQAGSLYHTPPTFAIYLVGLVLEWIEREGGAPAMQARNLAKARALYDAIASRADYYQCPIEPASRSTMNVVFRLPTPALEDRFVDEAERHGLAGLRGHRSVGGIRASLYNAVSFADVERLCAFMRTFEEENRP